jgi:hypothetical protein
MVGFIEAGLLRTMFGLSDAEIATIQERLPDFLNLLHVYKTHADQINRVQKELLPIVAKILVKEQLL